MAILQMTKRDLAQVPLRILIIEIPLKFCFPKSDAIKLSQLSSLETESCIFLSHKLVLKREKEINWPEGSTDKLIECIKTTLLNK